MMDARVVQSVLAPAGDQARHVAWLWWLMLGVCAAVFLAVVFTLFAAMWHSHKTADSGQPRHEGRVRMAVAAAAVVTVLTLAGLLVAAMITGRAVQAVDQSDPVAVRVTGYQWWWDVEYDHPTPSQRVHTANELHLPVGRAVKVMLDSTDVIHSFWAPTLSGKIDLVPGRRNVLWIRAEKTGRFRQQCAEFCGPQHAHMAMDIVVEPAAEFDAWSERQRQPAPPAAGAAEARGQAIVENGPCSMCHAIAGTTAGARTAPDLTHVGSRLTIAAGTLPNTPDNLRAWIEHPQSIKPGSKMPPTALSREDLDAVVAYLRTLQ